MTPKDVLNLNGDFSSSPLLDTLGRLDGFFTSEKIPYAVVGGLAVVRNGATRTTVDIDILVERADWETIRAHPPDFLETGPDHALDTTNRIDIDVLFPGDEWDMEIPVPHPAEIGERDEALGGIFAGPAALLELKCAVFRKKLQEDGIEIAAKDLSDVTELLKIHGKSLGKRDFDSMNPKIAAELKRIRDKVLDC